MRQALRTVWRAIRLHCPAPLMPALRAIYNGGVSVQCVYCALTEQNAIRASGFATLPSPRMRHTISGGRADLQNFLQLGEGITGLIASSLAEAGRPLTQCERVLDFGCGCGRLLLWMTKLYPHCKFYGTDIDRRAVTWCQNNLPEAICSVNQPAPPLAYDSNFFDAVYATSVFTHLTEEHQMQWLAELRRILKPGGVAFVSLLGPTMSQKMLTGPQAEAVKQTGFLATSQTLCTLSDLFPDSYRNTFVTEDYVKHRFTEYFDIVNYLPGDHDIVLLQKRSDD